MYGQKLPVICRFICLADPRAAGRSYLAESDARRPGSVRKLVLVQYALRVEVHSAFGDTSADLNGPLARGGRADGLVSDQRCHGRTVPHSLHREQIAEGVGRLCSPGLLI